MRTAITFAITSGRYEVVAGPEVPIAKQRADFKQLRTMADIGVDSIELWTSGHGVEKRVKLKQRPSVQKAADEAAEAERLAAEQKAADEAAEAERLAAEQKAADEAAEAERSAAEQKADEDGPTLPAKSEKPVSKKSQK